MLRFFTICARNYAARASALSDSIARHHPGAEFTAWMIDDGPLPKACLSLRTRPVSDAIRPYELDILQRRYKILEYATAVKPYIFLTMLAEAAGPVVYLDPDILAFSEFTELREMLEAGASAVLTPHAFAPFPLDGETPSDLDLLKSGVYNLGFCAISGDASSLALVQWWKRWLRTHASADPATGVFTDQKWLNLAPCYFDGVQILDHRGYNVAYWNLHERELGPGPTAAGAPLRFFHYSGFDPFAPGTLSKYDTRWPVKDGSPLSDVLRRYVEEIRAHGGDECRSFPTPQHKSGQEPDPVLSELLAWAEAKGAFDWDTADDDSAYRVAAQLSNGPGFPLYVDWVLRRRPDVAAAHSKTGVGAILWWIQTFGTKEMGLDADLAARIATDLGVASPESTHPDAWRRLARLFIRR